MRIELLTWEKAEPVAAPIRFAIFVEDKEAAGFELDDIDKDCVHAVVYDDAGKAIATARLLPDGQIGRMAVVKDWRRRGVGAHLLEALVAEAAKRGLAEVRLTAPVQALEFYRSQGFVADSKIQPVGGGLQQPMKKPLAG
ncbi:MAG TPA: GNAT family N-acetyltransferase [Burkholderiales bacterium]|nr:GNAT family N-acetyltransferase [Burkholderiales bacterium]